MPSLTPIRIRGKRKAPNDVKPDVGRQRKATRLGTAAITSDRTYSKRSTPSARSISQHRRRRRDPELSRLEGLPTEILQTIFEYSANIELPLASPRMATQLASRHLCLSLTSTTLQPVLDGQHGTPDQIKAAMRLMNSKFFTWPFFQSWLDEELEQRHLHPSYEAFSPDEASVPVHFRSLWTWSIGVQASPSLPPPVKLLRSPFNDNKVAFLQTLCTAFNADAHELDLPYIELAREGLRQAVCEGAKSTLDSFWRLGMQRDTELIRFAVIDSGCDKDLVDILIATDIPPSPLVDIDVDFLDPALWSWAEKAQAEGNEKGPWLKDMLKSTAQRFERAKAFV